MIRSALLFFLLPFFSLQVAAQQAKIDSLKSLIEEMPSDTNKITTSFRLARALRYSPEAKPVLMDAYALAYELGDVKFKSFAANNLGILHYYQASYDSAVYYFQETADIADLRNDKTAQAAALNNIGSILFRKGDYARSMDMQLQGLKIKEELRDSSGIGNSCGSIAGILMEQGALEDAIVWMEKCVSMFKGIGDKNKLAIAYANMAKLKAELNLPEEAIRYNNDAIALLVGSGDERQLAGIFVHLANVYKRQGKFELAFEEVSKAEKLNRKNAFKGDLGHALQIKGSINLEKDRLYEAILDCEEAKSIAIETGDKMKTKAACECLANSYRKQNQFQSAFVNLELASQLADSLMNEDKVRSLTQSEMEYSFNAERELERLREEQEDSLAQAEIEKQTLQKWFGIIGMFALGGIAFLLFRTVKQKKRDNRIIADALEQKEVLLKEIHHRVKNNLQVISSLLSLQSRDIKDDVALQAVNESRNRVKSMALIHQNLYKEDNLTGIDIRDYVGKLSKSLLNNYKVDSGKIELITQIDSLNLDVDTTIPLGLILNELMTNVLKYAFPEGREGKVEVLLVEKQNELHLRVSDNGVGYDPNMNRGEESTGFGMRMIKTFAKKLDAHYELRNEEGTVVEMKIRNFKKAS